MPLYENCSSLNSNLYFILYIKKTLETSGYYCIYSHSISYYNSIVGLEKANYLCNDPRTSHCFNIDNDISIGSVNSIIRKNLKYRLLCAHWIPRLLTNKHKNAQGKKFLPHYFYENKWASMSWRRTSSPKPTIAFCWEDYDHLFLPYSYVFSIWIFLQTDEVLHKTTITSI